MNQDSQGTHLVEEPSISAAGTVKETGSCGILKYNKTMHCNKSYIYKTTLCYTPSPVCVSREKRIMVYISREITLCFLLENNLYF